MSFIPGMVPYLPAAFVPLEMSFVGSSVSAGSTITPHASAQVGDWAVIFDAAADSAVAPASLTPTGYTAILTEQASVIRMNVSHVILSALTAVTGLNDNIMAKIMLVFRPTKALASATSAGNSNTGTSGDPVARAISAPTAPGIIFGVGAAISATTPTFATPTFSGVSPAFDAEVTQSGMRVGYKIYNSGGATQNFDTGDEGAANLLAGFNVSFTG